MGQKLTEALSRGERAQTAVEEILKYYYTGTDLTQIGEKPPENITGTKKEN